jgi:hypothetical protein
MEQQLLTMTNSKMRRTQKVKDKITVETGGLSPLIEAAIAREQIKLSEWARRAFAKELGVEPPVVKVGSGTAATAKRALAARWKKKRRRNRGS